MANRRTKHTLTTPVPAVPAQRVLATRWRCPGVLLVVHLLHTNPEPQHEEDHAAAKAARRPPEAAVQPAPARACAVQVELWLGGDAASPHLSGARSDRGDMKRTSAPRLVYRHWVRVARSGASVEEKWSRGGGVRLRDCALTCAHLRGNPARAQRPRRPLQKDVPYR